MQGVRSEAPCRRLLGEAKLKDEQQMRYQLRHWLFLGGVVAIAASPVAALTSYRWEVAMVLIGFGGLLLSVAAMLVPDELN
jgi:hypothetical protein